MSEKRDMKIFLTDILNAPEKIMKYAQELEESRNTDSDKDFEAITYNLLVLGEAARSIPEVFVRNILKFPGNGWSECGINSSINTGECNRVQSGILSIRISLMYGIKSGTFWTRTPAKPDK